MKVSFRSIAFSFLSTLCVFFLVMGFSQKAFAVGTLVYAPDKVDMAYDSTRKILYITSGGSVLRYGLNDHFFLSSFELGGNLKGIDISPDGNTLAVADSNLYGVHLIDLKTDEVKTVKYDQSSKGQSSFGVAFSNNHTLLITTGDVKDSWSSLKKYDLITNTFNTLSKIGPAAMISASADGSVVSFAETENYSGPFGRYRTADGNILHKEGNNGTGDAFNHEIAVNRNGTQYAITTYFSGMVLTDNNLVKKYIVSSDHPNQRPIGVAYSPTLDIIYFSWATSSQIYAYDTNTFQELGSYDVESAFIVPGNIGYAEGRIKVSNDGKYLFVSVENGIRFIDLSKTAAKPIDGTQAPNITRY